MSTTSQRSLSTAETIAITMRVALEHHDRGQVQEAAALYREVLGMDAAHAEALFLMGLIEAAAGSLHAAVQLLRAAVRAQPRAAHMHRALAETLLRSDRSAAALHCYWRILSLEPSNPIAYVNVGDVMASIKADGGNDAAALSCYQRALALDAGCASAHLGMGHIHLRSGAVVKAEAEYRAAIAADGRQAASQAALGYVLFEQQQYTAAADAFRRAILLQPRSPELLEKLGDALQHLGQTTRAEACYQRATELTSKRPVTSAARETSRSGQRVGARHHWPTTTIPTASDRGRPSRIPGACVPAEAPVVTPWGVLPVQ